MFDQITQKSRPFLVIGMVAACLLIESFFFSSTLFVFGFSIKSHIFQLQQPSAASNTSNYHYPTSNYANYDNHFGTLRKIGISRHYAQAQNSRNSQTAIPETSENSPLDLLIVGLGVGGHAAALHAHGLGMKIAIATGGDPGGTCVNRGCVPSKALLAGAKRMKMLRHSDSLAKMGIEIDGKVTVDGKKLGTYATGIAGQVRSGLEKSLVARGIPLIPERARFNEKGQVVLEPSQQIIHAKNILLATGSLPFVPPGVELDPKGNQVMTSDEAVAMPCSPSFVCIVGSGYIGLEFTQVFTALGAEVTLVEAGDRLLPGLDRDVSKIAERVLLNAYKDRPVKLETKTLAKRVVPPKVPGQPVQVTLESTETAPDGTKKTTTISPDVVLIATGRKPNTANLGMDNLGVQLRKGGFIPVDACMRVLSADSEKPIKGLYCIGDANGIMMLAHAASAQAIAAVETIAGREKPAADPKHIPAACFTSPEIAFVGYTEEEATELAARDGFELGKVISHFRANSKAVAEGEADGMLKVLFNKDNGQILGCHMIGMHASDLIQECANAISTKTPIKELAWIVHTHPTLSEVNDAAWKAAVGMHAH